MPSRISLRKHWISSPLRAHFDLFAKYYIPWKVSRPAHAARSYGQKRGAANLNAQQAPITLILYAISRSREPILPEL